MFFAVLSTTSFRLERRSVISPFAKLPLITIKLGLIGNALGRAPFSARKMYMGQAYDMSVSGEYIMMILGEKCRSVAQMTE